MKNPVFWLKSNIQQTSIYGRLAALFRLLEEGQIKPIIAAKFPILEAAKANELLESGTVIGNIVLLSPELMSP